MKALKETIHYGVGGASLEHARSAAVRIERYAVRSTVVVHAFGPGYDWLATRFFGRASVRVVRIDAFEDPAASGVRRTLARLGYLSNRARRVEELRRRLLSQNCRLVVSEREPTLSRAARAAGVPVLSIERGNAQSAVWPGAERPHERQPRAERRISRFRRRARADRSRRRRELAVVICNAADTRR